MFKGTVWANKGRVLLTTAQDDVKQAQVQAVSLATWHQSRPQQWFNRAICTLWMKTKYWKEKQTDSSAPVSILATLAFSPNHHGRSATSAGQALVSGVIPTSQNYNARSAYTDVSFFLAQKNTKNVTKPHSFYFYHRRLYNVYYMGMCIHNSRELGHVSWCYLYELVNSCRW